MNNSSACESDQSSPAGARSSPSSDDKEPAPSGEPLNQAQILASGDAGKHVQIIKSDKGETTVIRDVIWYSQNPSRPPAYEDWSWGGLAMNDKAGYGNVGKYGCGITCASMLLSFYGYDVKPGDLATWARTNNVYEEGKNGINGDKGWNNLLGKDGAKLTYDRGTGDRFLGSQAQANITANRAELFQLAADRARAGKISIGRIHLIDPDDPHDGWDHHFVLIVGVHANGCLIMNNPGRWTDGDQRFKLGNGSKYEDEKENWLSPDDYQKVSKSKLKGTKHEGGYLLMRVDYINSLNAPFAKPPDNLTEDNWQEWAGPEVVKHSNHFIDQLLEAAREVIVGEIEKLFDADNPDPFEFKKSHLDLLVREQAAELIQDARKAYEDAVNKVCAAAADKLYGATPDQRKTLAIKIHDWAMDCFDAAEGIAQSIPGEIDRGAKYLLDMTQTTLQLPTIPKLPFKDLLQAARAKIDQLTRDAFTFKLTKMSVPGPDGTMATGYGVSVHPNLLKVLAKLAPAVDWDNLHTDAELTFFFKSPREVGEAILTKVFNAIGLIAQAPGVLEGLITAPDIGRLGDIIGGRVRLKVHADGAQDRQFKPPPDWLPLKVKETQESVDLVVDFYSDGKARLNINGTLFAQMGKDGSELDVTVDATGRLAVDGRKFTSLWDGPKAGFDALMVDFLAALKGSVTLVVTGAGSSDITRGSESMGLFRIHGDTNLAFGIALADGNATVDIGAIGDCEISHGSKKLRLDLKSGGRTRFTFPSPTSFWKFVKDPKGEYKKLLASLKLQTQLNVRVKACPRETTAFGLFKLKESAWLTVSFDGSTVKLAMEGDCGVSITWQTYTLALSLGLQTGTSFSVANAPGLSDFIDDAEGAFGNFVTAVKTAMNKACQVVVKTDQPFSKGLLQFTPSGSINIKIQNGAASLQLTTECVVDAVYKGNHVKLGLQGDAGAGFALPQAPAFNDLWDHPDTTFDAYMSKLLDSIQGGASVLVNVDTKLLAGLFELTGTFHLDLSMTQATLRFGAAIVGHLPINGDDITEVVDLSLGGGGELKVALKLEDTAQGLEKLDLQALWRDPGGTFGKFLDQLPKRLMGTLEIGLVSQAGIPLPGVGRLDVGSGGKLVLDGTSVALKFQGNVALTAKKFGKLRIAMSVSGDVSQPWDYNVRDLTFPDIWGDPAGKFPVMLDNFVKDFNGTAHAHSQFDAFTELDDDFPWQDVRDKLKDWKLKQMVTGGRFDVDLSQGQLTVLFDILSAGSSTLINTATVTIVSTGSCQVSAGTLYAFAKDPTGTVLPGIMLQVLSTLKMQTMAKLVYKNATITANVEKMIPAIVDFNAAVHDSDNRISHFTSGFNKMLNAGSITFTDLSPLDFIPGNIALIVARFIWDVATA